MSDTKKLLDCTGDDCRSHHRAGSLTNDFSISSDFTSGCFGACTTKTNMQQCNPKPSCLGSNMSRDEWVTNLYAMLGPFTHIVVLYSACLSAWKVGHECACGA